jgi:uncharacterized YccA/Bax inhibitor family protein
MASNPVINKFGQASGAGRGGAGVATPSVVDLNKMYAQPAFTGVRTTRYMTLDDVVQRTAAMLGVLLVTGAVSWELVTTRSVVPVIIVAALAGFGLAMYMSLTMKANAVTSLAYAALEGVALGAISRIFNNAYSGIVVQAVTGTVMVAGGMLFVYKIGAIRVTPKFTRVVVGATLGVVGLMIVNLIAYLFTPNGLGLRSGGALAIVFSLVCIVVASMNLVMDFDMIEKGIRNGVDQKFAWYASFGLTVTLVWLYLEILRLLSYLRN